MNHSELKAEVYGRTNSTISDPSIKFAVDFYCGLEKSTYYATDVADCIKLARSVDSLTGICKAENHLIESLEKYKSMVEEACSFRDALREIGKRCKDLTAIEKRLKKLEATGKTKSRKNAQTEKLA